VQVKVVRGVGVRPGGLHDETGIYVLPSAVITAIVHRPGTHFRDLAAVRQQIVRRVPGPLADDLLGSGRNVTVIGKRQNTRRSLRGRVAKTLALGDAHDRRGRPRPRGDRRADGT
jgi:hypothetical protein